jgi:ribonuclease HI
VSTALEPVENIKSVECLKMYLRGMGKSFGHPLRDCVVSEPSVGGWVERGAACLFETGVDGCEVNRYMERPMVTDDISGLIKRGRIVVGRRDNQFDTDTCSAGADAVYYTDGSSVVRGGHRAAGAFVKKLTTGEYRGGAVDIGSHRDSYTAEQVGLLSALIDVEETTEEGDTVVLFTDALSVLEAMVSNRKFGGKARNAALRQHICALAEKRVLKFFFVRGHAGVVGNELADEVATLVAESSEEQVKYGVDAHEVVREYKRLNGWQKMKDVLELGKIKSQCRALTDLWKTGGPRGMESATSYMENPTVKRDCGQVDRETEVFFNWLRLDRWDLGYRLFPNKYAGVLTEWGVRPPCPWCKEPAVDAAHVLSRCYCGGDEEVGRDILQRNATGALNLLQVIRDETGCWPR